MLTDLFEWKRSQVLRIKVAYIAMYVIAASERSFVVFVIVFVCDLYLTVELGYIFDVKNDGYGQK